MKGAASALVAGLVRVTLGATVTWVEEPRRAGPVVYFANHSSHLDFLAIWSTLPRCILCPQDQMFTINVDMAASSVAALSILSHRSGARAFAFL